MRTFVPRPATNKQVTAPAQAPARRKPESIFAPNALAEDRSPGFDLSRVPANAPTTPAGGQGAPPIPVPPLASWLSQTRGTATGAARVLPESPIADEKKANAVTLGHTRRRCGPYLLEWRGLKWRARQDSNLRPQA